MEIQLKWIILRYKCWITTSQLSHTSHTRRKREWYLGVVCSVVFPQGYLGVVTPSALFVGHPSFTYSVPHLRRFSLLQYKWTSRENIRGRVRFQRSGERELKPLSMFLQVDIIRSAPLLGHPTSSTPDSSMLTYCYVITGWNHSYE